MNSGLALAQIRYSHGERCWPFLNLLALQWKRSSVKNVYGGKKLTHIHILQVFQFTAIPLLYFPTLCKDDDYQDKFSSVAIFN